MDDALNGFDLLGAEPPVTPAPRLSVSRTVLALAAGALGAVVVRKHPTLGFLNAAALASNIHAVATEDRTMFDAIKRMGRHIVSSAGSLALPKHPVIGYVAGAVAADLFIDDAGGGIFEEWARREDITNDNKPDVIDAELVTDNSKALVKKG